ncbi:MAG: aldehyde dehydrogenase family protein [Anaerostipes sp.]|nr:aldehyde dehydrogenase family protein [Anaerostipes sp.]
MAKNYKMYINGEWVDSSDGGTFEVYDPGNGELLGTVPIATKEDVDKAFVAARAAQKEYALSPLKDRMDLCYRISEEILKRKEEIATMISREQGKTYDDSLYEVGEVALNFDMSARNFQRLDGEIITAYDGDMRMILTYEAYGVYASITPWNYPILQASEYIGPAMVTGSCGVAKPASPTPLSMLLLAECMESAGAPKGVCNIITGPGASVGEAMVTHPECDLVCFTGEDKTGARIEDIVGLKKCIMELGGTGPSIVLDDADMKKAAQQVAEGAFYNNGQVCCATERVLVQETCKEEFMKELMEVVKTYKFGYWNEPGIRMGSMNSEKPVQKVEAHLKDGLEKGAVILTGGKRAEGMPSNLYFEPTVVDNVTKDMLLYRDETFGPVIPISTFTTDDDAIEQANYNGFGLIMSIFSNNMKRTNYITRRLVTGGVNVNISSGYWEAELPFGGGGGTKSGYGRMGGLHILKEMTYTKCVFVDFNGC